MLIFFIFFTNLLFVDGRFCADSSKGICEVSDQFGWCFHDKSTGMFSCDDHEFCKNQSAIQAKTQIAGCFDFDGKFLCCCNKGHLCNNLLVEYEPFTNITQKCSHSLDIPSKHTLVYKNCDEPWCFSFISSPKQKGATTTVLKGCESRSLLKHQQTKMMDQEFSNNTDWIWSEGFFNAPRCLEIIAVGVELRTKNKSAIFDGKERICLDFSFKQKNIETKSKICCCRGEDHCNEEIKWSDLAIQMAEIEDYRRRQILTSKAFASKLNFNQILIVIFVFAFFKF